METSATIIPAQFAYLSIPTKELRNFFDTSFATFAKCPTADYLVGANHRYKGGHDLLIDVFSTFKEKGIKEAYHQTGHILCTDFPTKSGIPIPGFSKSGLGGMLQEWGISSGWMQVNICDAGIGIFAIAESHPELCNAIDGLIEMNTATFFDTFVEGSIEVAFAYNMQNPILLYAGIENILAGCFSAYKTLSVYVDPFEFFGASLGSAIIGFGLTKLIGKPDGKIEYLNAIRSGIVGAMFVINPAFGFGAILALLSFKVGQLLNNQDAKIYYIDINQEKTETFLNCFINPDDEKKCIFEEKFNIFEITSNNIFKKNDILLKTFNNNLSVNSVIFNETDNNL